MPKPIAVYSIAPRLLRAQEHASDTELGLTSRNLLERLPWESLPLGLCIALNCGVRFARAAYRGKFA